MTNIPFHRSSLTHICWDEYAVKLQELKSYQGSEALQERVFKQCKTFCEGKNFYFVNSGTAALELALMAMELNEQDEVILPSLTFSSCANAVLRAGGVPCFSDISLPNMHVKLENILPLVTERTKAIMVIEYAGVRADLADISTFCQKNNIKLILDSAQSFGATGIHDQSWMADFVCYSFHDTKVFSCGEGGLLIVNNEEYSPVTDIMFEKGTNRRAFFDGKVDKYSWQNIGSSFILSDVNLILLSLQMERRKKILDEKLSIINLYVNFFSEYIRNDIKAFSRHDRSSNGHIFWLLLKDVESLKFMQKKLSEENIQSSTHYIPLHSSNYSVQMGFRSAKDMSLTDQAGQCLLRLPIIDLFSAEKIISTMKNSAT